MLLVGCVTAAAATPRLHPPLLPHLMCWLIAQNPSALLMRPSTEKIVVSTVTPTNTTRATNYPAGGPSTPRPRYLLRIHRRLTHLDYSRWHIYCWARET